MSALTGAANATGNRMSIPPDEHPPSHGGNLSDAVARYGTPHRDWLDLSTGINPTAYPAPTVDAATLTALPGHEAYNALIEAARAAYDIPASVPLIATPGTEIALRLLPLVAPAGSAVVIGPTYESHRHAWSATNRKVEEIAALADIPDNAAIVVLANPNNPDGRSIARAELTKLAGQLARKDGILIVDEAFADLDPDLSLAPLLNTVEAVVLRSFGKFYGLAGLRLGFLAGHASVVDRLGAMLGAWPVSSAALTIGRAAMADRNWQKETRLAIAGKADRLRELLGRHGLPIAGGTDLFILVEHRDAHVIHTRLAEVGIWTRPFTYRGDWLRFGLPADEVAFARLDVALARSTRGFK